MSRAQLVPVLQRGDARGGEWRAAVGRPAGDDRMHAMLRKTATLRPRRPRDGFATRALYFGSRAAAADVLQGAS